MKNTIKVDICILGAGSAGLSVAVAAVQMGARVVLIEAGKMGGDCLNYGCVPSKSLISLANQAYATATQSPVNMLNIMRHVQSVIDTLAPNDSVERFEKLGVKVIKAMACFKDKNTVFANGQNIRARRFVIATGSSPVIPDIPGIETVPFYTNETIFQLTENPKHLIILGGGPIGCELGQAFLRLGVKVTLLERRSILAKDEPDLVNILRQQLVQEGLCLYEGIKILALKQGDHGVEVIIEKEGIEQILQGSHLLVATGRKINVEHLNLPAAAVAFTNRGIQVDKHLRTTNRHIYAIGDVIDGYQFTHIGNYQAGIVIRNILFRLGAKVNYMAIPWVTYTDPELAHVGLLESEALRQDPKMKILSWNFNENDRAQIEGKTIGKITVITNRRGVVLGVSILGAHAGELLLPWIILVNEKKKIRSMASLIVPYPTFSEISKRVAAEYYTPILFSKRTRWLVRLLGLLG